MPAQDCDLVFHKILSCCLPMQEPDDMMRPVAGKVSSSPASSLSRRRVYQMATRSHLRNHESCWGRAIDSSSRFNLAGLALCGGRGLAPVGGQAVPGP